MDHPDEQMSVTHAAHIRRTDSPRFRRNQDPDVQQQHEVPRPHPDEHLQGVLPQGSAPLPNGFHQTCLLAMAVVFIVVVFQQVDFHQLEDEQTTFACLAKCQVDLGWFPKERDVLHTLREVAKQQHPDLKPAGQEGACSMEEINRCRHHARKYGAGVCGWLLWKLQISGNYAHTICLIVAFAFLSVLAKGSSRVPPQNVRVVVGKGFVSKLWLGCMALTGQVQTTDATAVAKTTVRAVQQKTKYSDFSYGIPPCATACGSEIAKCTEKGYFSHDVYMFWQGEDKVCNSFRTPVPSWGVSYLSQSTLGSGVLAVGSALADGKIDPLDVFVVVGSGATVHMLNEQEKEHHFVRRALIENRI